MMQPLRDAEQVARDCSGPATEANLAWRAELEAEQEIRQTVYASLDQLEKACSRLLALPSSPSSSVALPRHHEDMIRHHIDWRLNEFLSNNDNVQIWKSFKCDVTETNCQGVHIATQVAACCIDEVPWLVCCVCAATEPLVDFQSAPKSLLLHWSVTDDESSSWHNSIPRGWNTYPGVCEPHGSTAWQTTLAHYNPEVGGQGLTQIPVHSVVIQMPMDGIFLEKRGGIKFILKRNDTSDEVWIKSTTHGDFYASLAPAIKYLNPALDPAFNPIDPSSDAPLNDGAASGIGDVGYVGGDESEEESSSKFVWARALAEDLIIAREQELTAEEEESPPYSPSYAWLDQVTTWLPTTDYAINVGSSLSQYAKELRCLLEITGDPELASLRDDCARLEADIEALDAVEIQQRSLQLEKDRLWEERELAIKEAARVYHELDARVETARRAIVRASGRETEVSEGDLVDLCSSMILGGSSEIQGSSHGAGFFRRLFSGSESPLKHMLVSESVDRACGTGVSARVVTQVYFEGDASAVDAVMNTEEAADVENGVDDVDDEEDTAPPPKFPFDTVLVAIAFGEDFPSKISNSGLRLHWGFVTGRNGGWLPATPGTVAAIHRHREHVDDQTAQDGGAASQTPVGTGSIEFEAFHMRHKSGMTVMVEPLVRGVVLRVPASELEAKRITGIEFVVASGDHGKAGQHEVWMKKEGGSNFFVPIPKW